MRLFGYYAWHSFINQLRKLFKTWVLIFLVACMAIGALIGVGAAMLDDAAGGDEEIVESEVIEEEPGALEQLGIEPEGFVELIAGGIILPQNGHPEHRPVSWVHTVLSNLPEDADNPSAPGSTAFRPPGTDGYRDASAWVKLRQ